MYVHVVTLVYFIGILGLFWLNREPAERTSKALWIPVIWLGICASRSISLWFNAGPTLDMQRAYLEGSPFDAAVWGVLLVLALVVLVWRASAAAEIVRTNFPLLLYFAYCCFAIMWADYPFVSAKRWIKAVGDVVMIAIVLTDSNKLMAIKRLLSRVTFVLIPASVLTIKYYPDIGRSYNPWTWTYMYSGVTTGKNLLGMTCLVCGLASLWMFLLAYELPKSKERRRRMLAHGAILLMVLWLFHQANSMTSLSCFLLASLVMLFIRRAKPTPNPLRIHFAVTSVILLSLFALFLDSSGVLVKDLGRDPTLTGRTDVWKAVLDNSANPLFGAGFEGFWIGERLGKVWATIGPGGQGLQEAHNGYLEIYLNLGWLGIALFAFLMITGYRRIVRAFRNCPDVALLMLSYFTGSVIYGLTEAAFRMMACIWIAALLSIMSVSPQLWPASSSIAPEPETDRKPGHRPAAPIRVPRPDRPQPRRERPQPVAHMRKLREGI